MHEKIIYVIVYKYSTVHEKCTIYIYRGEIIKYERIILLIIVMFVAVGSVSASNLTETDVCNDDYVNEIVYENVNINENVEVDVDMNNSLISQDDYTINDNCNGTDQSRYMGSPFVLGGYQIFIFDVEKYYKGPEPFVVTILDSDDYGVSNFPVLLNINGVNYTRNTNEFGQASLPINLQAGDYLVTTYIFIPDFNISGSFTSNVHVKSTIDSGDLIKYFRNGTQFQAVFCDSNGDALENTTVMFNINGVCYYRLTNSEGMAKLNINLPPDTYFLTSYNLFNNESKSNLITVLSRLYADNLTMQYCDGSKFNVTVLDEQGNLCVNQSVLFNVNGVFYNRTTNNDGVASLNIRLPVGEYIITTSCFGQFISNKILITE